MAGVKLTQSAAKKTARVVKQAGSSPLRGRQATSRRLGGAIGKSEGVSVGSFSVSVSKNDSDEYIATIESGLITIENKSGSDETYAIPTEIVNINEHTSSTDIYIYTKVQSTWGGVNFNGRPTLTISSVNIAQNNTLFPALDEGHFYYPIAIISQTVTDDVKSFSINQILKNDIYYTTFAPFSLQLFQIFQSKASDTAADTTYDVFVTAGQANLPDANVQLDTAVTTASVSADFFCYLEVTATESVDGDYYEDFDAVFDFSATTKQSTASESNYLVGRYGATFAQTMRGDFITDGRTL